MALCNLLPDSLEHSSFKQKASDSTNQEELSPEESIENQHQPNIDDDNNNMHTEAQENVMCQQPDNEPPEMFNKVNAGFIFQGATSLIVSSLSQDNIDDDLIYCYYCGDKQFNFSF
nr:10130_t:CDS:2 [Entrophospora candida]